MTDLADALNEVLKGYVIRYSGGDAPTVHVPDDPSHYGKRYHGLEQPSGAPVRGTPMSPDDERIPDTVYHMTTDLPSVLATGRLLAKGKGGLGGDRRDRIVSMTTDPHVARQLAVDTKFVADAAKRYVGTAPPREFVDGKWVGDRTEWATPLIEELKRKAKEEGWEYQDPHPLALQSYDFGDHVRNFFLTRESVTHKTHDGRLNDPQYWDTEKMGALDPDKIGVVTIPKTHLKTGAMVTDFDLGNRFGLKEIRSYGDVPVSGVLDS